MAGSASNWYKVGFGQLKGQRVYIAKQHALDLGGTGTVRSVLAGNKTHLLSVRAKIAKAATQTPPGAAKKGGPVNLSGVSAPGIKAQAQTTEAQNARIQAQNIALRLSEVQARLRTGQSKTGDAQYQNELEGILQKARTDGHIKTSDWRPSTKPEFQAYARKRKVSVTFLSGKQADAVPGSKNVLGNAPDKFTVRVKKGTRSQTLKVNENRLREIIDDFAFGAFGGKGPRSATSLLKPLVSAGA
jgi:hypothetical protein